MKITIRKMLTSALAVALIPAVAVAQDDAFSKSMDKFLENDANVQKIGDALERYFKKKRDEQAKQAAKKEEQKLEDQFKNPVKIDVAGKPTKGNPDAKVTIVEFSDFQCPFCSRGKTTMEDVLKEYPNDVKVVFLNLPLPFHPEAKPAAIAALAAGEQGKFWEMHDALFDNQQSLGEELYPKLAKDLGLDVDKFKKDMADPKFGKMVDDDAALATKLGVRGTPGFFVNGVQVRGARPLPYFKNIIDRWLKKTG